MHSGGSEKLTERWLGKRSQFIGSLVCEGVPGYGKEKRKCVSFVHLLWDCLFTKKTEL